MSSAWMANAVLLFMSAFTMTSTTPNARAQGHQRPEASMAALPVVADAYNQFILKHWQSALYADPAANLGAIAQKLDDELTKAHHAGKHFRHSPLYEHGGHDSDAPSYDYVEDTLDALVETYLEMRENSIRGEPVSSIYKGTNGTLLGRALVSQLFERGSRRSLKILQRFLSHRNSDPELRAVALRVTRHFGNPAVSPSINPLTWVEAHWLHLRHHLRANPGFAQDCINWHIRGTYPDLE